MNLDVSLAVLVFSVGFCEVFSSSCEEVTFDLVSRYTYIRGSVGNHQETYLSWNVLLVPHGDV